MVVNPDALNYNINATISDNSCIPIIYGCIDSTALNYNENANTSDNISFPCIEAISGCNPSADNFNPNANFADGNGCFTTVFGCTDSGFKLMVLQIITMVLVLRNLWMYEPNAFNYDIEPLLLMAHVLL